MVIGFVCRRPAGQRQRSSSSFSSSEHATASSYLISAILEHRDSRKKQAMGASAARIYCAIYIFIYGPVIEHKQPFFIFFPFPDVILSVLSLSFFYDLCFTITISRTRDTSDPH